MVRYSSYYAIGNMLLLFSFVKGTFASQNLTMKEMINALTLSVLSLGILPAVTEEMVFRGMILSTLQSAFGKKTAVFISSILFALYYLEYIDSSDWKKVVLLIVSVGIIGQLFACYNPIPFHMVCGCYTWNV